MIRTFIIDDHPMVIAGIQSLMSGSSVVHIAGFATTGPQALDALRFADAEVVLMDINLGDENGIELCAALKKDKPGLKVLGISTFKERSYIARMLEAGASGYLLKNASRETLEEGIVAAWRGGMYFSGEAAQVMTSSAGAVCARRNRLSRLAGNWAKTAAGRKSRNATGNFIGLVIWFFGDLFI
jgi:DNA-binding NarL/FixJ family response regulator